MKNVNHFEEISCSLGSFLKKCPTAFQAVDTMKDILEEAGYERLFEEKSWNVVPGGKYYVIRNYSSIIAVHVGKNLENYSLQIAASHTDSPTFKIKEEALLEVRGKYTQLNTEGYGGMICSSWLDRPLSIAGRVIVKEEGRFVTKLLDIDRDLVMIPNVAIHMNREVNDGFAFNKQVDMLPLIAGRVFSKDEFKKLIAEELGVSPEQIIGTDLYLYNRMQPSIWGADHEFISCGRLDDLQCAYASLNALLESENDSNINVFACMDNEEVGSGTKQGAASTFLPDVLSRLNKALGKPEEDLLRGAATGFMLSCDNAHAVHPNHPEHTDAKNCSFMNEGIVIKSHAGQKYTSDGLSIAAFKALCEEAGVPTQYFANRSDKNGGSTLGNISMGQLSLNAVDIGLPQLAMHSSYETAGVKDTAYMIEAIKEFYGSHFRVCGDTFAWEK